MNLDEAQRSKVAEWIAQGLKLAEIQNRLIAELKVTLTYMEVRVCVDDLKLTPKDPEPAKPVESPLTASAAPAAAGARSPVAGPRDAIPTPGRGGRGSGRRVRFRGPNHATGRRGER